MSALIETQELADCRHLAALHELRSMLSAVCGVEMALGGIINIQDIIAERPDAEERDRIRGGLATLQDFVSRMQDLAKQL